jgi:glycerol-3-phosphate dehydrogenase
VNVAAIRSTGMSASLGIAERVREIVHGLGVPLEAMRELEPGAAHVSAGPWWRRTVEHQTA